MNPLIKTPIEIEKMRIAGRLAAEVLDMITPYVKIGISTLELNQICHDYMVNVQKSIPAPLNYHGYPKSICTSLNHVVCHGIPNNERKLKEGDILNIDITVLKDGYHGDTSRMFCIGKTSILATNLVAAAKEALNLGIAAVKPGAHLTAIGAVIENYAKTQHFSVVEDYCGHGIGRGFHEEPRVLHYKNSSYDLELKPGMTFTIEPMLNAGKKHTKTLPDNWTVVTRDHSLSAQWEHTILVTDQGVEILTLS